MNRWIDQGEILNFVWARGTSYRIFPTKKGLCYRTDDIKSDVEE